MSGYSWAATWERGPNVLQGENEFWAPAGVALSVASGGGDAYHELTAPTGELWVIVSGVLYHDDAAARVMYFVAYDGSSEYMITSTITAVASGLQLRLPDFPIPMALGGAWTLRGYGAGMTAAAHIIGRYTIRKLRGCGVISNA